MSQGPALAEARPRASDAEPAPAPAGAGSGLWLGRVIDGVSWIVTTAAGVMFLVMTALVCLQVLFRYVLNSPLTGSEEGARALLIFVTMLGAAVALGSRAHMAIDYFKELCPPMVQRAAALLSLACVLVIAGLLLVKGAEFAERAMIQTTPALRIPKGYIVYAFPISGALMIFYALALPLRAWMQGGGLEAPARNPEETGP